MALLFWQQDSIEDTNWADWISHPSDLILVVFGARLDGSSTVE